MSNVLDYLQQGFSLLIQLVFLGIAAGLIWLRKKIIQYVTTQTTARTRDLLSQIGKEAFAYAETVYGAMDGPAKLNEAIKYMLNVLGQHGYKDVPMQDIRAVIEQAWLENRRQSGNPVVKPTPFEIR